MKDSVDRSITEEYAGSKNREPSLLKTLKILKYDDQLKGAFQFNHFLNSAEHAQDNIILSPKAKKGSEITDHDVAALRCYITKRYDFSPVKVNLDDAILDIAMEKQYHPIKEYIEKIRWDGIKRLNSWLRDVCGAEDNAYTQAVGRKMFVAAVKRLYEPGCYYAQLVILEGPQRLFKSRLVKEMGMEWYASIHLKTKDTKSIVEEMRGKWILEIEELAGFSKQETEYMKAFISRQSDRTRLSFGRRAEDFPRQSIMIATMNPEKGENKYLVDQTGNVRYWPIQCDPNKKIEIDAFIDIRDQLYAEALQLYRDGENLWLDSEAQHELAEIEQEKRLSIDPWGPKVEEYLSDKHGEVTTVQIAEDGLKIPAERIHSGTTRRIGRALAELGWIRKRKNTGSRAWYYIPPEGEKWEE